MATINGVGGALHPFGHCVDAPRHYERGGAVEQNNITIGAGFAAQQPKQCAGIKGGIAPAQPIQITAWQSSIFRRYCSVFPCAVGDLNNLAWAGDR